jgi:hypothetical protein
MYRSQREQLRVFRDALLSDLRQFDALMFVESAKAWYWRRSGLGAEMTKKTPASGLKDIDTEADAERLKAHLKLIDDLASGPKVSERVEPKQPPLPDDASSPD